MLHNERTHHNEKPTHHNWKIAPARCNWKKPMHSKEDPAQSKKKKKEQIWDFKI